MRRLPGQHLRIGVSGQAVALLRAGRWRWPGHDGAPARLAEQAITPGDAHPFDAIAGALRAVLEQQRQAGADWAGWPVVMLLADELTRLWQVTPPAGATRLADIDAAAGLRFQALYGEAPGAWQLAADVNARQPFFAAAVPRALPAVLQLVAREYQLSMVGLEPHFIAAWNRWRGAVKPGAWFALVHENLLTLALVAPDGRRALAIRALPVPHGADRYWLTQALAREAMLQDIDPPALLQACGAVPAAWTAPATISAHVRCVALQSAAPDWSGAALLARGGSRL